MHSHSFLKAEWICKATHQGQNTCSSAWLLIITSAHMSGRSLQLATKLILRSLRASSLANGLISTPSFSSHSFKLWIKNPPPAPVSKKEGKMVNKKWKKCACTVSSVRNLIVHFFEQSQEFPHKSSPTVGNTHRSQYILSIVSQVVGH